MKVKERTFAGGKVNKNIDVWRMISPMRVFIFFSIFSKQTIKLTMEISEYDRNADHTIFGYRNQFTILYPIGIDFDVYYK